MNAIVVNRMQDLLPWSGRNKRLKKIEPVRKKRKRGQARKNRPVEIQELEWLKKHLTLKVFLTIIILVAMVLMPFYLSESDIMPLQKIRIQGTFKHLNTVRIKQQLSAYLGRGFFSLDIQSIQRQIARQNWIQSVSIQRVWPGELRVDINEKQAVARWDDRHLLSSNARVFKANSQAFGDLPLVHGFKGDSEKVFLEYRRLSKRFGTLGVTIREMIIDGKGALTLLLGNRIKVKMGSEQRARKIKHFVAIYPKIIRPQAAAIRQIDFRYSNGFAIAWKSDVLKRQDGNKKRSRNHV